MGLSVGCKGMYIDVPYSGFRRLRMYLAEKYGKGFGYDYLSAIEGKIDSLDLSKYDMTEEVADFFFTDDCDGKINYKVAKILYHKIEHDTKNFMIGYSGRKDCAYFSDFKEILKESSKRRINIYWN